MLSSNIMELSKGDQRTRVRMLVESEAGKIESLNQFATPDYEQVARANAFLSDLGTLLGAGSREIEPKGDAAQVYQRNPAVKGPMDGFGYSYLDDKLEPGKQALLKLSGEQAYEALNFVNGVRTIQDIHDWMTLVYGSVEMIDVVNYLSALESIDVVTRVN